MSRSYQSQINFPSILNVLQSLYAFDRKAFLFEIKVCKEIILFLIRIDILMKLTDQDVFWPYFGSNFKREGFPY